VEMKHYIYTDQPVPTSVVNNDKDCFVAVTWLDADTSVSKTSTYEVKVVL